MIKVGMIVRYARKWCNPGEEKLLLLVRENRCNPVTGKMTRWVVQNLSVTYLGGIHPVEDVEDYMIEDTGLTLDDLTT